MKFENTDTEIFMYLVRKFVADKYTYLLPVREFYRVNSEKTLLGYYDNEYVYLIPSILIGMCNDYLTRLGKGHLNIQLILNTLFRANLIKVNWVMRRYITFIRRELINGKKEDEV